MVFHPPPWVPKLPIDPPDSVTIADFMKSHGNGGRTLSERRNPYTCGLTGRSYSWAEVFERVEFLARALSKRTGWAPNAGTPWDKVGCVFSLNSVDYIPTVYAIHRLSGIVTPANAVYSVAELEHQLKSSGSQILITCVPLLDTALQAAKKAGIANDKIFILPMAGAETSHQFPSIEDLIKEGKALPELEALKWTKGQGARQPAMLSYSSGTSGLPKAVMVSHRNVIANVIQQTTFEEVARSQKGIKTQVLLGLLPLSHIYGLIVVAHSSTWRGDEVIILPKFELETLLAAIQKHKIEQLLVVPPIVIRILRSQDICRKYDMSSVRFLYTGAAPMGKETIEALEKQYPKWVIGQAYGMTETATVVVTTSEHDILHKSSGSLVPGTRAKLVDLDGSEITEYDKPGELLVQSPSVTLGYHNNEKATAETFIYDDDGRWIRTGDEVLVTLAPSGNEHFVVVDRIKELIKVKGHQVAPAELEAHLLTHPAVSDCTVIQVPDDHAGEVPKAFVVKAAEFESKPEEEVAQAIIKHVADHKASYKHLKGGVEFIDVVPKSPSGKILRRFLRDKEREKRRKEGGKL